MQKMKNSSLLFCLLFSLHVFAQQTDAVKNYINQFKDIAIQEMQRTGVPAAITLAQGIHESGIGQSRLATLANNHFGIKCKSNWTGESISHDDDAKNECFRKYSSPDESYRDHSDFLKSGQRYAFLFQLEPTDYIGWANGLKQAGYATNPKYAPTLIKLIEDYHLQDYTLMALNNNSKPTDSKIQETGASIVVHPKSVEQTQTNNSISSSSKNQPTYPTGLFKINDTKVIYAFSGTSYLSIAEEYNIDLRKLFEINEMKQSEEVEKGGLIYLQKKKTKGEGFFHIVESGETLYDIAQKEAIRLKSLMELNLLTSNVQPAVGERLFLREKAAVAPKLSAALSYSSFTKPNNNSIF